MSGVSQFDRPILQLSLPAGWIREGLNKGTVGVFLLAVWWEGLINGKTESFLNVCPIVGP